MKRQTVGISIAILILQFVSSSQARGATILPQVFQFNSSYGINLSARLTNQKPNAIDMVPGDTVILELSAELVDPEAVTWPTQVEFIETDYNLFKSPNIQSFRFKGYALDAYLYCTTDENYFRGNNISSANVELPWDGKKSKAISKIKLPKICNEMIFQFQIGPTIQEIILDGNLKTTGRGDLDYWFLEPETSDEFNLGEIRNHVNILHWPSVEGVTIGMKKIKFIPKASAGKVIVSSLSKSVCVTSKDWVLFAKAGTCDLQISVEKKAGYDEIETASYSFEILKAIEIQCVKNDKLKVLSGTNPKCPAGYKRA